LSLEEALSCIPPILGYSSRGTSSTSSTNAVGDSPLAALIWEKFFDEVNEYRFDQQPKFEKPQFDDRYSLRNEEDVRG
ncbi:11420_t:CDS:1, partial [Ambispora gerdemannii]